MKKNIPIILTLVIIFLLSLSFSSNSFAGTTDNYIPRQAPLTNFATVQYACQYVPQTPKTYYFTSNSPSVSGTHNITATYGTQTVTYRVWSSGYVQKINVPVDTTINIYTNFTQGIDSCIIGLTNTPYYSGNSTDFIAYTGKTQNIGTPFSVNVQAGTYYVWIVDNYYTLNNHFDTFAFTSNITLGNERHQLIHCSSRTNKSGCKYDMCKLCGKKVNAHHPGLKHYKKSAGLLKNGSEYDLCSSCGQIINKKTIAGYSKSYVKGLKIQKAKKAFTVKWKKQSTAKQKKFNGYQIRYSVRSNMRGAKTTTASKTSKYKRIKGLKSKKTYYIQVRTYTKVGKTTFYSKWTTKKVRTK